MEIKTEAMGALSVKSQNLNTEWYYYNNMECLFHLKAK